MRVSLPVLLTILALFGVAPTEALAGVSGDSSASLDPADVIDPVQLVPPLDPVEDPQEAEFDLDVDPAWGDPGQSPWIVAQADTSVLTWTNAYVTALETQTDLVLQGVPLSNPLTRIELAQWLAQFFAYIPNEQGAFPIADMEINSPDYWTAQAVIQAGAMNLYAGDEFRPSGDITKLEALAILVRALQLPTPDPSEITRWMSLYTDAADVPEIGHPFIAMAGRAGLLVNVPDPAQIKPNVVLSRGEGAVLLHQTLVYQGQVQPLNPPVAQLSPAPVAAAPPPITAPTPLIPPSSTSSTKPEISATRVIPESGSLQTGDILTIEAQATSGSELVADIGPTIQGLRMQEISTGIYRTTYAIQASDAVSNPAISIQATRFGETTRVQRQYPQLALGNAVPPPITGSAFPPTAPNTAPISTQPVATPFPPPTLPQNQAILPQPTPPPSAYPRFTGIRLTPERNLIEGDILTFTIQASPGALAQFDFGSLVRNQPMREIQSGVYEGTYVVAPDHQVNYPTLRVVVSQNGLSVQHQEIYPFKVDGSEGVRSTIQQPSQTGSGSIVPGQPQITSVTSNAAGQILRANDVLIVTMRGDQGGQASFRIVDVTPGISMQEISPGLYEGQVRIPDPPPQVTNGVLEATLERNGQRQVQVSAERITIGS